MGLFQAMALSRCKPFYFSEPCCLPKVHPRRGGMAPSAPRFQSQSVPFPRTQLSTPLCWTLHSTSSSLGEDFFSSYSLTLLPSQFPLSQGFCSRTSGRDSNVPLSLCHILSLGREHGSLAAGGEGWERKEVPWGKNSSWFFKMSRGRWYLMEPYHHAGTQILPHAYSCR